MIIGILCFLFFLVLLLLLLLLLLHLPLLPSSISFNFPLSIHFPFFSSLLSDGTGNWSTNGCTMTSYNQTTDVITCECDHLTNFAFLVVKNTWSTLHHQNSTFSFLNTLSFLPSIPSLTSYTGVSVSLMGLMPHNKIALKGSLPILLAIIGLACIVYILYAV